MHSLPTSEFAGHTPLPPTQQPDWQWLRYAAGQVPQLRTEARAQQALAASGTQAVQTLALICGDEPLNGDWPALLLLALVEGRRIEMAFMVAQAALQRFPLHTGLRLQYWALCERHLPARERTEVVKTWLAQVTSGTELKALLRMLPAQADTAEQPQWGVVEYHAPSRELRGWALNLEHPEHVATLRVHTGQGQGTLQADRPHPLLLEAGLTARNGGFQVRLPDPLAELSVHFEQGPQLVGSPLAAVDGVRGEHTGFGPGSPIARGEPWQAGPAGLAAATPPAAPVDILIPVFKGYQATLDCVHSVLRAQAMNRTEHHVVVLDDAGPDLRLAAALRALAGSGRIQYLRHEANLGFIRNMNRGMVLHPQRDVVWLNADTRVHGDWLDRLRKAAYHQAHTASATPFSNNGELMSFPEPRVAGPVPGERALSRLDTCAAQVDTPPPVLPVGCGFCFYVKRAALDAVGLLDEVHLQRGYGEETDWCLRARQGGWQHAGAPNVYVAHAGGASFGSEKALRAAQNNAVLRRRFLYAERDYQAFVAQDPLAPVRATLATRLEAAGLNTRGAKQSAPAAVRPAGTARRLKRQAGLKTPCLAWLILDTSATAAVGARWLALARRLARQELEGAMAARLLTLRACAWSPQWQATGAVTTLPELLGLTLAQRLQIWDARAAVSLAPAPDDATLHAAQACALPVYAPDTPAWRAVGAWALEILPGMPDGAGMAATAAHSRINT